jgi:hypothetical protein
VSTHCKQLLEITTKSTVSFCVRGGDAARDEELQLDHVVELELPTRRWAGALLVELLLCSQWRRPGSGAPVGMGPEQQQGGPRMRDRMWLLRAGVELGQELRLRLALAQGNEKKGAATIGCGQLGWSSTGAATVGRGARVALDPQGGASWGRAHAGLKRSSVAGTGVCRVRTRLLVASRLQ